MPVLPARKFPVQESTTVFLYKLQESKNNGNHPQAAPAAQRAIRSGGILPPAVRVDLPRAEPPHPQTHIERSEVCCVQKMLKTDGKSVKNRVSGVSVTTGRLPAVLDVQGLCR